MGINAYKAAKELLEIIEGGRTAYAKAQGDEEYFNAECTDLNHALELLPLTPRKRLDLSSQLAAARWNRRKAKEDIELLKPLAEYLRRQKGLVGDLRQIVQQIEDVVQEQTARVYRPRVRKDLGEIFAHRSREETAAAAGNIRRERRVGNNIVQDIRKRGKA